ncbi:YcnI family protein [Cryobacterium sp. PH31-O1]|uniref:YcnI family copper-binding membrane protein n=1 Tax=Cryobacterium sp. PH31-O1 TaxID=3046306 RepID=UPI0024BB16AA|nr:YcnI family protein [Cryobacterium sp. PH31-O1]MDJ0338000.1 YcnI family protein [Cryobacterium sp. PH31-O1]
MKFTTPLIATSALAAGMLLALAAPLAASAHVTVTPDATGAGAYTVLNFSTAHGCEGSSTTTMTIDIPKSITSVSPTVNPGWTVEKIDVDLATPIDDGHGNAITTRVGQISYRAATPLPDGFRDTFALSLQLPADAEGETLEFPVLQTCEVGETNWNETTVPGEDEPALPAPFITVTAATGDAHGHSDADTEAETVATHDDAAAATAASADDVLARVLGAAGLVVGAVGIVLAVAARRKQSA